MSQTLVWSTSEISFPGGRLKQQEGTQIDKGAKHWLWLFWLGQWAAFWGEAPIALGCQEEMGRISWNQPHPSPEALQGLALLSTHLYHL